MHPITPPSATDSDVPFSSGIIYHNPMFRQVLFDMELGDVVGEDIRE